MLVDFPSTAEFLTPEERAFVVWKKSEIFFFFPFPSCRTYLFPTEYDNSSVGEEEHFEMRHFWDVIGDWQVHSSFIFILLVELTRRLLTDMAAYIDVYVYCCSL